MKSTRITFAATTKIAQRKWDTQKSIKKVYDQDQDCHQHLVLSKKATKKRNWRNKLTTVFVMTTNHQPSSALETVAANKIKTVN